MKKTFDVNLDGLKHERDKDGCLVTTLHLELPSAADTRFLARAHRIAKGKNRETASFTHLSVNEEGRLRMWTVTSKGSKTKDYKVVAVVESHFNAHDGFEHFLNPVDRDKVVIDLIVEIVEPTQPLFPLDGDDDRDGPGRVSA